MSSTLHAWHQTATNTRERERGGKEREQERERAGRRDGEGGRESERESERDLGSGMGSIDGGVGARGAHTMVARVKFNHGRRLVRVDTRTAVFCATCLCPSTCLCMAMSMCGCTCVVMRGSTWQTCMRREQGRHTRLVLLYVACGMSLCHGGTSSTLLPGNTTRAATRGAGILPLIPPFSYTSILL